MSRACVVFLVRRSGRGGRGGQVLLHQEIPCDDWFVLGLVRGQHLDHGVSIQVVEERQRLPSRGQLLTLLVASEGASELVVLGKQHYMR